VLPVINLGPLALQTPGLLIILGLWLGLSLAEKWAPRFKIDAQLIYNLVFITLISGIIGARLVFVARHLDTFRQAPLNLVSLNPGLLDPLGGLAIAFLAALIFTNRKNIPFWPLVDALTPFIAVTIIFFAFSQFASGDAFGSPTDLPWGIHLWNAYRHPVQLYNALVAIFILVYVRHLALGHQHLEQFPGRTFLIFIALSSFSRVFLEAFRGDSLTTLYNLRIAQILAFILLAIALAALLRKRQSNIL
jgi:phosphatidylglycerol:prolipoprotein diacylglycerol transferase